MSPNHYPTHGLLEETKYWFLEAELVQDTDKVDKANILSFPKKLFWE